ncbi:MAG: hypothetical protein ACLTER_07315 [Ruminococcus sp.]
MEEADPEVLTGEPCASRPLSYSGCTICGICMDAMVAWAEQETILFTACFYVFPQFKRTVEILKETGYPVSMDDVKLKCCGSSILYE